MATPTSSNDPNPNPQKWSSLTELGFLFGISALVVGKTLKKAQWRKPDGQPEISAVLNKQALVYNTPVKFGQGQKILRQHVVWSRQKGYDLLCSLGFKPIGQPDDVAFSIAAKIEHILKSVDVKKIKHKVAVPWEEKKAAAVLSGALNGVDEEERMPLALDVVHHLENTLGRPISSLEVIFQGTPGSWEAFKRQKFMALVNTSTQTVATTKKPKI